MNNRLIKERERLILEHSESLDLSISLARLLYLYSKIMLFSGAKPTQALRMFSSIALCFESAFTTGVPGGTCFAKHTITLIKMPHVLPVHKDY